MVPKMVFSANYLEEFCVYRNVIIIIWFAPFLYPHIEYATFPTGLGILETRGLVFGTRSKSLESAVWCLLSAAMAGFNFTAIGLVGFTEVVDLVGFIEVVDFAGVDG